MDAGDTVILCHASAHILRLFGGLLFPDESQSKVKLMYLPFLRDLEACGRLSWGSAVLACLYREMCRASKSKAKEIGGPLILLQVKALLLIIFFPFPLRGIGIFTNHLNSNSYGHGKGLFRSVC